jgi:hypothetical protein
MSTHDKQFDALVAAQDAILKAELHYTINPTQNERACAEASKHLIEANAHIQKALDWLTFGAE